MNPNIDLSKQRVAYEDEAVILALTRILSNKYKHDVEITSFVREDIKNTHRCVVSRLYLKVAPPLPPRRRGGRGGVDKWNSCDEMTVIVKQFHPDWLGVDAFDSIIAHEALGRILSGKRIAPELYGTVRDVEKRRYWLFMEDLGKNLVCGREDFENEEMKHCFRFIEKVAKIHLLFAENDEKELQQVLRPLIREPRSYTGWRDRYESAIERAPSDIETIVRTGKFSWLNEMAASFITILEPCRPIIAFLVSQPFVFGHWDMAPEENLVIGRFGEDPIYYFMDWDDVYFGPALDNLPISEEREETERLALVERYWGCVQGSHVVPEDLGECLMMYKHYRLMRAIYNAHFHIERAIERQLQVNEEAIRRAISMAIKLAEALQMM